MIKNFDNKGWKIDRTKLWYPEKPDSWNVDELFESPNKDFACLTYNIEEYRMGFYGGLISIFENKDLSSLLVNPKNQWFSFNSRKPIIFSDNFLIMRKLAYNPDENLSGTPFSVFDLEKKVFGFFDFDPSSIYYSLIKTNDNIYQVNLDNPNGLKNMRVVPHNRHGEALDITTLKFYPFSKTDIMTEIYFAEKMLQAE
ncbi:MAG: hypothetical protein JST96_04515 [Bacteroidetes bacterium]|nr:hypothetical protein [Bacteroidota bacterium]